MFKIIHLDAPLLGSLEKQYLNRAIDTGYVSTFGPYVQEFEEKFSNFLGCKYAVSTQSGTSALHMALHELGIGRGDEVIVPALTFAASINPVIYAGADPVFVDVDINTWNISLEKIKQAITKRTKAVIPVHLYGNPCKMDDIMILARKYGLYVIEDATESLGSKFNNRYTGTFGDFGCFSFNGNKTITTGGGGMIVSNNKKRIEHIRYLINQAKEEKERAYYHSEMGFNYRMTNIEASLGLAQFTRLNEIIKKKKVFNQIYRERLKDNDSICFQEACVDSDSAWWLSCATIEGIKDIPLMIAKLKESGIQSRRIFSPIPKFPYCRKYKCRSFKNAEQIFRQGICLPSSALNSVKVIADICKKIKGIL